jgi:putative flippase GtrA
LITRDTLVAGFAQPTERTLLQVPRALIASALAALLDFAVLVFLVEALGMGAVAAAIIGYLAGGVVQYFLCSVWVFPASPQNLAFGFTAFVILSLGGLGITWGVMTALHDDAGVNYALAKVAALGLAFCWNFLSRKFWLFKTTS